MRDIGKNIKMIRISRNMTQDALAEALFVTRQTVSNYENGRSRPDIDTVLKIAQIFGTDANAVIYGPPVPENRKRAITWLICFTAAFVIFGLSYLILNSILAPLRLYKFEYVTVYTLNKVIMPPLTMFALGWCIMHILSFFTSLRPLHTKWSKRIKLVLWIIMGILVLIPAPYIIWMALGWIRSILYTSVSMSFPNIPIYHPIAMGILKLMNNANFIYLLLGGAFWLFDIPHFYDPKTQK